MRNEKFAGEIPVTPAFERAVHKIVATIPRGKVATYGQIAEMAGAPGAAREVGHVMARVRAEQDLPCHRVVNKTGTLAPDFAFGGQERQRLMLEEEGVTFLADGRIDMSRHQWGRGEQLTLFP
ncbi:MGMT family protein [Pyramidobacter sp. SM-530-WT-4B]|uniref:MGMT family protein n=1 Tax=Pyramidobacter porci TaxID=2605789 RepID=A0A6L5YD13_9BACT|nr:MGMT family protein [Pyramidobacter porci]MCI6261054.1 MGMT family protein [Pyramidobacter sp.]MST55948.1 MGMT family protein [Pyramidobacter porci]